MLKDFDLFLLVSILLSQFHFCLFFAAVCMIIVQYANDSIIPLTDSHNFT